MREGRELSLSLCLPDLSESLSSFSLEASEGFPFDCFGPVLEEGFTALEASHRS
jgi:hypothetical protein